MLGTRHSKTLETSETSFNSDTQLCYIEEDENLERDPMSINDQQSSDGNDNGETSFSYDDTHLCLTGEDERDSTTTNIQHSPDGNDNENLQEEDYTYDNDQGIGECLLGREVLDLNDALNLYKAHARALGFSVRKGTSRRRGNNSVIFEKYFVCSKAGLRGKGRKEVRTKSVIGIPTTEGSESIASQRKRKVRVVNETRTDCKAYIRFKMTKEGKFVVTDHNIIHNHDFVKQEECHCLRSKLSTSKCVGKVIETMVASGSKQMDCCKYLCMEDRGKELDGDTKTDYLKFVSMLKMKNTKGGDMQNVLDVMQQRTRDDSSFFYRVKVNDDNQIVSIFWRDSMMVEDYMAYRDVLIFDTTYRINRYSLICAPFVGINKHWKTTMFACAFISDEKTETFEWLLETFKNSMSGLVPKSIFTDQNLPVTNAVAKVFPTARLRLCIWHLQTNFISHFDMLKSNPTFKDDFNKCLTGCDNEEEFLKCWTEMISTYGLEESFWFSRLYDLRDKWCTALSKDFFSARVLSSQKVEVIRKAISFRSSETTSLFEFYRIFEDTVKSWRSMEESDNFKCTTERHPASESRCKLLKHAAEVYTLDLFDDFQKEFDMAMGSYIRVVAANQGSSKIYEVSLNEDFTQSHNVRYDDQLLELSCTCMSYRECGLLCYHILRVMHMHCIFEIPEKYIMKRWTKLTKSEIWTKNKDDDASTLEGEKELQTPWSHSMARSFYNLLTTCQFDEHARKVCENGLNDMHNALKQNL
ncbi:protein FAR1-RELATED SEQUENCE 5 isoform X2 [Spinacia oleracea]|uniref:Protein FAR1-RELATED SEQUENCE 5 isoform X2 n=1 Tax=Spinacia oleracea TaxID=3562 RepID=A0ABM3R9W4_SPIOL|nr:protein FAR1-RELATED SEQUENCE 5-like isoform X2 [Spinacia oleracea]